MNASNETQTLKFKQSLVKKNVCATYRYSIGIGRQFVDS